VGGSGVVMEKVNGILADDFFSDAINNALPRVPAFSRNEFCIAGYGVLGIT
jgi:hypothetical protein